MIRYAIISTGTNFFTFHRYVLAPRLRDKKIHVDIYK